MENLFQAIMYLIFGKKWIKYTMVQGLKVAIYIAETEMKMSREKFRAGKEDLNQAQKNLENVKSTTVEDYVDSEIELTEEEFILAQTGMTREALKELEKEDPKKHYMITKEAEHAYKKMVQDAKNTYSRNLQIAENEVEQKKQLVTRLEDDYAKKNGSVFSARTKLDFISKKA